ncbi:histidine phosphatase family protein [Anaeroselena agilis]|uniref:Histidine phosphatase family protein n=1 Tax=Anaeroselena agilis TaxID=3063788 RepID=A0ABU3NV87_9FIRM|nr:histidine phosphatase family protein [Selenomonadales bacterium 4137-cl]
METRTIYLCRHGKIHREDDQRRYLGQLDPPLSGEGERQAGALRDLLGQAGLTAIYCSDLARSRRTAEIVAARSEVPVIALRALREISLGEWEGVAFADIARRYPDEFRARGADIAYYRVPGGESFADCALRVVAAFREILASSAGDIAIIGHAGANRVLLCHILGMPVANLFRLGQDYACLNIIQCGGTGYRLKLVNHRDTRS